MHNFSLVCGESNPCQNGGTCLILRSGPGYECNCPKILDGIFKGIPSFVGRHCEKQIIITTSTDTVPLPVTEPSPVVMGTPLDQQKQGDKEHYEIQYR